MTRLNFLRTIVSIPLFGATSIAQRRDNWERLGDAHVDGGRDHDEISVGSGKGEFRAIRFYVQDGAIEFERIVVHFRNGTSTPIPIRARIRSGQQSRVIDLPGRERVISSVEVWYGKGSRNPKRPQLVLFGLH